MVINTLQLITLLEPGKFIMKFVPDDGTQMEAFEHTAYRFRNGGGPMCGNV